MHSVRTEPDPARLELRSADVVAPRVAQLAALFPEAVRDGRLDADALRAALGEAAEPGPERFGLTWPGKAAAILAAQRRAEGALVPQREESVAWDQTGHVVVEGENLGVLKLLQRSYHRRVKLISIDPPYNTGNDFVYPDDFRDPLDEYLRYSGQRDAAGGRLRANRESAGRHHSAWLSMMWPRLHLARALLRDDGVLVVSIDDTEAPRLRLLLDEIFGEENFLGHVVWKHAEQSKNDERFFSRQFNSLFLYARSRADLDRFRVARTAEDDRGYRNPDDDPRGPWRAGDTRSPSPRPSLRFPVTSPQGHVIEPPPNGWRWNPAEIERKVATGEIWFPDDGRRLARKIYLADQDGRVPENLWAGERFGTTRSATQELKGLFGGSAPFDTPKPVRLMERLLALATTPEEPALVLDFFAGSGSLGDAVLRMNAADGGQRRFLLVQLPEPLDDAEHPTIAALTRARLRAVVRALAGADGAGFRAYRLGVSGFAPPPRIEAGADGVVRLIEQEPAPARDDEALLAEVLLGRGFELTASVEWVEADGARAASVDGGALLACFADQLTLVRFEALLAREPAQLVLPERAFGGDDELKVNALQRLATANAHGDRPVELLVV